MATEARTARNYTGAFALETRQHTILGIDLGEGPARKPLIFGLIVFVLWIALVWSVLGVPTKFSATLYILPPALITWFGAQRSPTNPRRFRFTTWVLAAMFMLRGHLPIISLGRRRPTQAEKTPWNERRDEFPWSRSPAWERPQAEAAPAVAGGRPVRLRMKARLLGNEHVAEVLRRRASRKKGKKS